MSETENLNGAAETADTAPKKGGKKLIIIALAVVLLGGAAGGYFYMKKMPAAAEKASAETPAKEKKSKSSKAAAEDDQEEPDTKSSKSLKSSLPEDEDVKKVVELQPFIVNLADAEESRYLRLTVSVGVGGESGGESEKPDQLFITRVRNAMLLVLSSKTSSEVLSAEGKAKLRKELLKAAQTASEEPHVEAIYITDFIVQM